MPSLFRIRTETLFSGRLGLYDADNTGEDSRKDKRNNMKIVINPLYKEFQTFIATLPEVFEQEGEIIFQGRNVLKRFQIKGISFIVT